MNIEDIIESAPQDATHYDDYNGMLDPDYFKYVNGVRFLFNNLYQTWVEDVPDDHLISELSRVKPLRLEYMKNEH